MPGSDGLELIRVCARVGYVGPLILMSGGFELYPKMAEEIARTQKLNVVAKLPKPFRPKQFSYLLMSLIQAGCSFNAEYGTAPTVRGYPLHSHVLRRRKASQHVNLRRDF